MTNEIKAKEWIENSGLTASKLANLIDVAIDFVDGDTQMIMGEDYQNEVCMEIIAPNSAGLYIPEYVAQYLGMELPDNWLDDEFIWEDIESLAQLVADELHILLGDLNTREGSFYFGTIEDWGDFALFYTWDTE